MVAPMSERLTKPDWVRHGLLTLAKEGPAGLKVGPMAAKLKVSRGSFYWHFADIADFRAQLLEGWRAGSTEQIIDDLDGVPQPDRLKSLLRRTFGTSMLLERAVRAWAAEDNAVAKVVSGVDDRRVAHVAGLLVTAGVGPAQAAGRATFLYWAFLGQAIVMHAGHARMSPEAMDGIAMLFEA